MYTGKDLENDTREILRSRYGLILKASAYLDHNKVDFIVAGFGLRHLAHPIKSQMTIQGRNARKLDEFIEHCRKNANGLNVYLYILAAGNLSAAQVAQAIYFALARKPLAVPDQIHLLEIDARGKGYWRDIFTRSLALRARAAANRHRPDRRQGQVVRVVNSGIVIGNGVHRHFAFFIDIDDPHLRQAAKNKTLEPGRPVTFISTGRQVESDGPYLLAESVRPTKRELLARAQ